MCVDVSVAIAAEIYLRFNNLASLFLNASATPLHSFPNGAYRLDNEPMNMHTHDANHTTQTWSSGAEPPLRHHTIVKPPGITHSKIGLSTHTKTKPNRISNKKKQTRNEKRIHRIYI